MLQYDGYHDRAEGVEQKGKKEKGKGGGEREGQTSQVRKEVDSTLARACEPGACVARVQKEAACWYTHGTATT